MPRATPTWGHERDTTPPFARLLGGLAWVAQPSAHPKGFDFRGGGVFQELPFRPVFLWLRKNLGASQMIRGVVHLAMRAVVTRWGENSLA